MRSFTDFAGRFVIRSLAVDCTIGLKSGRRTRLGSRGATAGFTLLELILVIVILGTLSATALPKFINLSAETHQLVVRQTAASFRTAVLLAHSKWLVSGTNGTVTNLSGFGDGNVDFSATGWPTDTAGRTNLNTDELASECINVWRAMFQNPPSIVARLGTATPSEWCVDADPNFCIFFYRKNGNDNCNGADEIGRASCRERV